MKSSYHENTILILGSRVMQLPAIHKAKEMGLRVITIDPDKKAIGFKFADHSYVYDLADKENCLKIAKKHKVNGVMTLAADYPIPMVAHICENLGLHGLTTESAVLSTNKKKMRQAFFASNVPSPMAISANSFDEAKNAIKQLGFPVIFKPAISHGGRGVTQIPAKPNINEIEQAFNRAMSFTKGDGILVEEFVEGPEFSVEAVTYNNKTHIVAVTDKLTSGPPYFIELGHNQPSQWSCSDIQQLVSTAMKGIEALGINWSPSHTEIKLSPNGPRIIEIGARLGGGFITTHLTPFSTGVDMVKAAIFITLGKEPITRSTCRQGAAIRFLCTQPGIIKSITGVKLAEKVIGVREVNIYKKIGDKILPLVDGTGRLGHVISVAKNAKSAIISAKEAQEKIIFNTVI